MAKAITYRSGEGTRDLRTVLAENVTETVVLLRTGRMEILTATLLHGTTCRHEFWAAELGAHPDDGTFAIPVNQVVARREMTIAVKVRHK